jgi:hypothetical protein
MDIAVHTNGMNGDAVPAAPEPSASFNPDIFRKYLLTLLPPVIGADPRDLHTIFDEEFNDRVARFVNETGGVIYVVKSKEESEGSSFFSTYFFSSIAYCLRGYRRISNSVFLSSYPPPNIQHVKCHNPRANQT